MHQLMSLLDSICAGLFVFDPYGNSADDKNVDQKPNEIRRTFLDPLMVLAYESCLLGTILVQCTLQVST